MQAYARWRQGEAEADAYKKQASLLGLQAEELLARAEINNDLIRQEAGKLQGEQIATFAGQGVSTSGLSVLAALEETARQASEEIYRNTRDARYEAGVLGQEADFNRRYAKEAKKSALFDSFGTILAGAGSLGSFGSPKRSGGAGLGSGGSGGSAKAPASVRSTAYQRTM